MKTAKEMAEEYLDQDEVACAAINRDAEDLVKDAFLAGYKAAMDQVEGYKAKAEKWGQELCELNLKYADKCVAYAEKCAEDEGQDAMDQVADASKVITKTAEG